MYLKEIVASGFKSFADKLNIRLDNKITCIVGPNGSGKSNIVDAVRWVLGEQSVKSLRGDGAMSDVIFSGSKSRKPLNMASIELIFDNSDHYINVPYTDISIKRKVYRSGENEYYLNNERCRLKDIINLLLDSGVGKESFNIISQGEVDRILSSSPLDRRIIFEEAAGILKYKTRKNEALKKLDHTHTNIERVNDIITELENQLEPLREQSIKAKEYLENKEKLTDLEIALLAHDIEEYHNQKEMFEKTKKNLNEEITELASSSSKNDAHTLLEQQRLEDYEKKLGEMNKRLLEVTEEVEKLNGEKNLLRERNENSAKDDYSEKLRVLLENKGTLEKDTELLKVEKKECFKIVSKLEEEQEIKKEEIKKLTEQKNMEQLEFSKLDRDRISIEHTMNSLQMEMDTFGNVPNSVKQVLSAKNLSGICATIGSVIEVEEKYVKALEIAISSCKNFIITEDEASAVEAVHYLKDYKLGRATFFPLSVIQKRYIDSDTLNNIKEDSDFLEVIADIASFDKRYENVIYNQLGCVLLSTNLQAANRLSRKIKKRYKIVTLDGDVVHVGGSLSGGSSYQSKSLISIKHSFKEQERKIKENQSDLKRTEEKIENITQEIEKVNNEYLQIVRNKVLEDEKLTTKENNLNALLKKLEQVEKEIDSYRNIQNNNFSKVEEELISKYNEKNLEKEKLILDSQNLSKEVESLKDTIEKNNADYKLKNLKLRDLEKESQNMTISITKCEVKLDTMLQTLSEEYSMTYERAKAEYFLEKEVEQARREVQLYKNNIKRIGMVNLDSIEEFERINKRYEFLTGQRQDLLNASNTLLDIMNEMDAVMIEEFKNTFEKIKEEFKTVFKELFKGGSASLELTNPNDMLTTGVEIVASPPGKKLTTISLLSGGEKTFTAISLLFAILNVKTVPFCIFDEVEAALDEANVDSFGKYLNNYRDKTQFLIITHKKKTMEFADTLYGITMQESGVSKLVSVKLDQKVEVL